MMMMPPVIADRSSYENAAAAADDDDDWEEGGCDKKKELTAAAEEAPEATRVARDRQERSKFVGCGLVVYLFDPIRASGSILLSWGCCCLGQKPSRKPNCRPPTFNWMDGGWRLEAGTNLTVCLLPG